MKLFGVICCAAGGMFCSVAAALNREQEGKRSETRFPRILGCSLRCQCESFLRTALTGIRFYTAVEVVDPDQEEGGEVYEFSLADAAHGACFNLGEDDDGNTLISWSQVG